MSASTDRLKQAIAAGEVGAGRTYESVDQAHRACCAPEAAAALRLTAPDLLDLGVIDEVVEEPLGAAHRDPPEMAGRLKEAIRRHLAGLDKMDADSLLKNRYEKFRKMGTFLEERGTS